MDGFKHTSCDDQASGATNEDIYNQLDNGTDRDISKETKKYLSEGDKILSHIAKLAEKNPEEYGEKYAFIVREREELQTITIEAFCNDQKVTRDELRDIRNEFQDVHSLSERKRDKFAEAYNKRKNRLDAEVDSRMRKIKNYDEKQALHALAHTQKDYILDDAFGASRNTNQIIEIHANNERDAFQKRVIQHLFNISPEIKMEYVQIYNKKSGYNLVDISSFEESFENTNINNVEARTLKSYLTYLKEKHGGDASSVILRKIDMDILEEGSKNSDIIQDFLNEGSTLISVRNALRGAKGIKEDLEGSVSDIQDPLLQKYIREEIQKLGDIKGRKWEGKPWSLLLLSVVFKQSGSKLVDMNLAGHEQAQRNMINELNGSGSNYVIGHTNELSYYPIKIQDYKDRIKSKDISILNPLALANYLDHLDQNEGIDEVFKYLPYDKLETIQKQLQENNEATDILKNRGLGYIKEIIINFSPNNTKTNIVDAITNLEAGKPQKLTLTYIKNNLEELTQRLSKDINVFLKNKYPKYSDEQINERAQEVMIILEKLIKENADIKVVIQTLNTLGMDLKVSEDITKMQKQTQAKKVGEIQQKIDTAESDGDSTSADKYRQELTDAEYELNKAGMNADVVGNMSEEELRQVANGEKTVEEIIEDIKARNQEFAERMKQYEDSKEPKLPEPKIIESEFIQAFSSEKVSGTYTIETSEGEKIEGLTDLEFKEVSRSKEARENLVDMKHTCEKCNLPNVWENRHTFFRAIGNMNTLGFNVTDGNYVNPAELKFLLTIIVSSVGKELGELSIGNISRIESLKSVGSLTDAVNLVQELNGESGIITTKHANGFGDSIIEKLFIEKFMPREGTQTLNQSKLENALV